MSRKNHSPQNSEQCQIADKAPKDDPQAVKKVIERNREELNNGAQVPGGAYDVDPAYAAAAAEGADDSFGGDLAKHPDKPTKSP